MKAVGWVWVFLYQVRGLLQQVLALPVQSSSSFPQGQGQASSVVPAALFCLFFSFLLLLLFKIYVFYECFACMYVCIVYAVSEEVRRYPVPCSYSCELPCGCRN